MLLAAGPRTLAADVPTPVIGRDWTRTLAPQFSGAFLGGLAPTPNGFVAVGYTLDAPVAFVSDRRASRWRAGTAPMGPGKSAPSRVIAGPAGMVATGTTVEGSGGYGTWWSPDGRAWELIELPHAGAMDSIAATPDRFVGVGSADLRPTSWTSTDGRTWEELEHPVAGAGLRLVHATPLGIIGVGPFDGGPDYVWRLVGNAWREDPAATLSGLRVSDVAWMGESLIAVGDKCLPRGGCPSVWISQDGVHWHELVVTGLEAVPTTLVSFESGILGIDADDDSVLWRTTDGAKWGRVPSPSRGYVRMTYGHGVLLAINAGGQDDPSIWISPPIRAPDTSTAWAPPTAGARASPVLLVAALATVVAGAAAMRRFAPGANRSVRAPRYPKQ